MSVRKYSKTTLSLLIMISVLLLLWKILIKGEISFELIMLFLKKIYDYEHLYSFTASVMKLSVCLIIISGILNTVLKEDAGFEVFSSIKIPLFMFILLVIASFLSISQTLFWLIVYILDMLSVICSYSVSFENCCNDKRNIFTFPFKIKEGATKQDMDKIDSTIFYILSALLSVCFWILFISAVRYVFINKAVIFS